MAETDYGLLGGLRGLFFDALKLDPCELHSNYKVKALIEAWNREIDDIQKVFDKYEEVSWTPVKERLPKEKNEKYWICTDTGYQCECRWTNVNRFWSHLETDWHWNIVDIPQYSEVVAWMPLPESYKEDK